MPKKTSKKSSSAKKKSQKKMTLRQAEKNLANKLVIFGLFLVILGSYLTLRHQLMRREQQNIKELEYIGQEISNHVLPQFTQEILEQADLNQDGQLNVVDAELIKAAFRKTDADSLRADLNADNRVDTKDYSLFIQILKLKAE